MARKKKYKSDVPRPNDGWIVSTEIQINGRNVVPGTELKIKRNRGRFRFLKHVTTEKGVEWIEVIGGPKGAEKWRSFRVDAVKTVHYKKKSTKSLAQQHKEKLKIKKELEQELSGE